MNTRLRKGDLNIKSLKEMCNHVHIFKAMKIGHRVKWCNEKGNHSIILKNCKTYIEKLGSKKVNDKKRE